jgi:hypothetical protein
VIERRTVADRDGCYSVGDLPVGTYSVRAALTGFCDGVRENVTTAAGEQVRVDFTLRVGPLGDESVVCPWYGWAESTRRADAVIHLRIEEALETRAWPSTACGSDIATEYRAQVLSVVKGPDSARISASPFRFTWDASYPRSLSGVSQSSRGDEFVAFLAWVPSRGRLSLGRCGLMVPVKNGVIARKVVGDGADANGKKVDDFLAELRGFTKR